MAIAPAAIIGYVGSEAAEEYVLERLVWPQRFNRNLSVRAALQQSLLMTIGGPIHKASLKALDVLRTNGLYRGACRGHMLGTVFFKDFHITHFRRSNQKQRNIPEPSRNGFWIRILQQIDVDKHVRLELPKMDLESSEARNDFFRSTQAVRHLKLDVVSAGKKPTPGIVCVNEGRSDLVVVANVILSEFASLLTFLIAAIMLRDWLLSIYMLLPLAIKLLFMVFSVRREGLMTQKRLEMVAKKEDSSLSKSEAFEVVDREHEFMIVEGPQPVVVQFFRHYGHPIRENPSHLIGDRLREVAAISLIVCLFLYFPVGLVMTQWLNEEVQYVWLGYQLYAVIAMHVVRVLGWQEVGSTADRISKLLSDKKTVWLQSSEGCTVSANLTVYRVASTAEGKLKIKEVIDQCEERLENI